MAKTNQPRIVNLSTEDINAYSIGEYISYGNRWVNFGVNNDYPEYLRSLYLNSGIHQQICDNVAQLATGEGIHVINPEKNPISNKWINDNFPKETIKKLISDLKIYGYCAIQIYGGSKCLYSPAIKYRMDVKDDNGNINYVWFSENWEEYSQRKNRPVKLPIYQEGSDEDELSVMIIQLDKKSYDYYSPVDYTAIINYISLDKELSTYFLNLVKNSLASPFIITFIGSEFSDEMMNKIESDINKKFTGANNAGRAIIGFTGSKDDAPIFESVDQPDLAAQWQWLATQVDSKILIGHGITSPLMVGIRDTGGGLGNNAEELQQSYSLYFESKLKAYQNYILQGVTKILNGNLLYAEIEFITYNPFVTKNTELAEYNPVNEIDSQEILSQIDLIAEKPQGQLISEKIFGGQVKPGCLYKFVKSSNKSNIIIKKLELMDKKGYLFAGSDIIKNTKDYYFLERIYYKNN